MAQNPFTPVRQNFKQMQRRLPREIGRIAENHFKQGFQKGGGSTDASARGWPEVQRRQRSGTGKRYQYKGFTRSDRTRGILVGSGSGQLKRSIKVVAAAWPQVKLATVGPDVNKYAAVHNEGLRSGRGSGFTMPKREFMGKSKSLERKIFRELQVDVGRLFSR